jgi:hypothetical protein
VTLLISDSFFPSTARLSAAEKARILDFITVFQSNPKHPSIELERVRGARDRNLWSGHITDDLRAILYKDGDTWAALIAGHHDETYNWAERRRVGRHPVTGALQIVETVETVQEEIRKVYVEPEAPPIFASHSEELLLSLGVPESWLPVVREVRNDDGLLTLTERLPHEIGERLLRLADGELVTPPTPISPTEPATNSPDTRERFAVLDDEIDLVAALRQPMARWIAFLHPSQRLLVERTINGPVKDTGSAGPGKTVVALHRARKLAREGKRVLFTTYIKTLAGNLRRTMALFASQEELDRVTFSTVHAAALAQVRVAETRARPANDGEVVAEVDRAARRLAPDFDPTFVRAEWENVIQAQGIASWTEYRSASRVGRGKPLSTRDRKALWAAFESAQTSLAARHRYDWAMLCHRATELMREGRVGRPYDAVLVDEVQDLRPPELRFVRQLADAHPEHLMLVGDAGQRLYAGAFSLRALGIDVVGRSHVLRINYRTTEQIRRRADELLGDAGDDLDGGTESRKGTRSLVRGPEPVLRSLGSQTGETTALVESIRGWLDGGLTPPEIGVFSRTNAIASRLVDAFEAAGIPAARLGDREDEDATDAVQVGTMHGAKGLEFKAVAVAGCADGVLPSAPALRSADDPQDRERILEQERRLLYVAMTRARDELLITWFGTPSPFLEPLLARGEQ